MTLLWSSIVEEHSVQIPETTSGGVSNVWRDGQPQTLDRVLGEGPRPHGRSQHGILFAGTGRLGRPPVGGRSISFTQENRSKTPSLNHERDAFGTNVSMPMCSSPYTMPDRRLKRGEWMTMNISRMGHWGISRPRSLPNMRLKPGCGRHLQHGAV